MNFVSISYRWTLAFLVSFSIGSIKGQDSLISWNPPLEIPLFLSGNFGELRSNHFHSGLDIKTQGREGLKVFATEEGYVSRIKISPYGYGNAVYIDHPNGFTTVYAHLQSYNEEITAFAKSAQYDLESFAVDLYPTPGQLPVQKGEVIGLSGNSGSSGGPHLHFEIRETDTEFPVNPLLFDFKIQDNIPPEIRELMIIPLDDNSTVQGKSNAKRIKCNGGSGKYSASTSTINATGNVGLAVDVIDKLNGFPNKCGIYKILLYVDEELVFEQVMDKLNFDTKRYINSHQVYEVNRPEKKFFQRNYLQPNNGLEIYGVVRNGGAVQITEGEKKSVRYEITDVAGNVSRVSFKLSGDVTVTDNSTKTKLPEGELMRFDTVNAYRSASCTVYMPEGRLYDDYYFVHKELSAPQDAIAALHQIGDTKTPVHKDFVLKIKTDSLPKELQPFALVAKYDPRRKRYRAKGGNYDRGWMETRVKEFGKYTVLLDTIAPVIKNSTLKANMSGQKSFRVNITDNLSGIDSYNAYVNGMWILGEYDPKRARVTYELDKERIPTAETYKLRLVVKDERGNESVYESEFSF